MFSTMKSMVSREVFSDPIDCKYYSDMYIVQVLASSMVHHLVILAGIDSLLLLLDG